MDFNPFDFISNVWLSCYEFLTMNQIAGYSLWNIMFSIFLVGTLVKMLRLGTGKER